MQTAHQGNIGQSIPIKYESMSIYFQRISIILAENVDKNQKMKNQLSSKSWFFTIFHFRTFATNSKTNSNPIWGLAILCQKVRKPPDFERNPVVFMVRENITD